MTLYLTGYGPDSLKKTVKLMHENIERHARPDVDPAMHNLSVALLQIAETLMELDERLTDLQRRFRQNHGAQPS